MHAGSALALLCLQPSHPLQLHSSNTRSTHQSMQKCSNDSGGSEEARSDRLRGMSPSVHANSASQAWGREGRCE